MRVLVEVAVAAFAAIAGVVVTRARFGRRLRRTPPDDRGDLAGVTADVPSGPRPRSASAKAEPPDDEA